MGKRKILQLRWPEAGLVRNTPYQSQPPYSTPDCLNVRPVSTKGGGRTRGGSRPGLAKHFYEQLGSGNPVRMLAQCTVVKEDKTTYVLDTFNGATLGSQWSTASWIGTAPGVSDNLVSVSYNSTVGAVREAISDLDTAAGYTIRMFINPYQADHHGKYQIFARMDTSSPLATTKGIVAELVLEAANGDLSGTLKDYSAGSLVATTAFTDPAIDTTAQPGWFEVLISGNNITCKWRGSTILTATAVTAHGTARVGFGINCTQAGGICLVDTFRVDYTSTSNLSEHATKLIASSNGLIYQDTGPHTMSLVTLTPTLASDRLLHAAEYAQKLYIADNGNYRVKVTDGVKGTGLTKVDSASISDWTAYGITAADDVVVVTNATLELVNGTYKISAIGSGELTLTANWGTGTGTGTATVRIERAPKVYDPVAQSLAIMTATAGTVPTGCPLIATYRGRIVLAGPPVNPHLWWMSAQDAPLDFDFTVADSNAQRAIEGESSDAGKVAKPLTGLIAGGDDYLIFANRDELWVLRGDPAFSGSMDCLSRTVGMIDKGAYCFGPGGEIFILTLDGIYAIPPGIGQPQKFSRDRLPNELIEIDPNQYEVTMAYDIVDEGIHIFLSGKQKSDRRSWWVDWSTKSFWPVDLADTSEPFSVTTLGAKDATQRVVLLGCRDGYLRAFNDASEDDDGTAITSYLWFGPVGFAGSDYQEGRTQEIIGTLGAASGNVTWSAYRASTHEGVLNASSFATGTLAAGLNRKHRPVGRGRAFGLKLAGATASRAWDLDSLAMVIEAAGPQRIR